MAGLQEALLDNAGMLKGMKLADPLILKQEIVDRDRRERARVTSENNFTEMMSLGKGDLADVELTTNQQSIIAKLAQGPIQQVRLNPYGVGHVIRNLRERLQRIDNNSSDEARAIMALIINLDTLKVVLDCTDDRDKWRVVEKHKFPNFVVLFADQPF